MIDVIMWSGATRRQVYLNPDDIQTLNDEAADAVRDMALRTNLQEGGDSTVCVVNMRDFDHPRYLFHDAAQVARAIVKYRVLMQVRRDPVPVTVAEAWYDPIKVDE